MVIITLLFMGLCLGSFINALVWRVREQSLIKGGYQRKKEKDRLSILSGRSMCPNCHHELSAKDLLPLVSWIWLRGKCRYCQKNISWQYPVVELLMALLFVFSYVFWPYDLLVTGQQLLFITWLLCSVGLLALAIYDLKWMLLPNRIVYPTLTIAAVGRLAYILIHDDDVLHALVLWLASVLIASGIFWILFELSKGKWIGFGDVRLGWITGTLLATPSLSLLMIFIASLLGTMVTLPLLTTKRHSLAGRIPFGPYLIAATMICLLFGERLIAWYQSIVLL